MPFISIQLNSNRPGQIERFFDSVEATADRPEDIEILLHIDTGDTVMEKAVKAEQAKRRFTLRLLQTDLVRGYATLWKPLNPLWEMTHPDAYFVINVSDEMLFETKGWDSVIRKYEGYYPDHIFRLRASKYRFRNYTDFWECGYAPDSLAFYTRRWLELSGDWNPCLGPDSFQQCVAFYLFTSDPASGTQYNRDIALTELTFTGEGASIGLEGRALYNRIRINNRAWFVLMSHRMQQEAKRRAMRMKSHMIAHAYGGPDHAQVTEKQLSRNFRVVSKKDDACIVKLPYGLSWLRVTLVNIWRMRRVLYFAGGGKRAFRYPGFGILLMIASYVPFGTGLLTGLMDGRSRYHLWRAKIRHPCNHLRGLARTRLSFLKARLRETDKKWELLRQRLYRSVSFFEAGGKTRVLSFKLGLDALSWVIALGLYTVSVRARLMLPTGMRKLIMPISPFSRPWSARFKQRVKRRIQAIPELRFVLSLKGFYLAWLFMALLPRMLLIALFALLDLPVRMMIESRRATHRGFHTLRQQRRDKAGQKWKVVQRHNFAAEAPLEDKQTRHMLFSLQLCSGRPEETQALFDTIERTADHPERIEVLVHIDMNDKAMERFLTREQTARRFHLRFIGTGLAPAESDRWKARNALFDLTNIHVYFISFLSDTTRFETQGWDTALMGYMGYYPDHVFRVRASLCRFRNYMNLKQCLLSPDSRTFYTRQWLALQGDCGPSNGVDAFQQCVSYYLLTADPFSHIQYHREIAAPFLRFSGEEPDLRENDPDWRALTEHAVQQNARRRAMGMKAWMMMQAEIKDAGDGGYAILENPSARKILLRDHAGFAIDDFSYAVGRWKKR